MSETQKTITLGNGCKLSEREYELYLSMQQPYIVCKNGNFRLLLYGKIDEDAFKSVKETLNR